MRNAKARAAIGIGTTLVAGVAMAVAGPAASAASAATTLTCATQTTFRQAAPSVGGSATVNAAPSGSYVVSVPATATVAVSGTPTANSGWTARVMIPSGTKVRLYYNSTSSTTQYRFTTHLSSTGKSLITHVVMCS